MPLPSRATTLPATVFDQVADVYTRGTSGAGGSFTVLARAALPIAFRQPTVSGASGGAERSELLGIRRVIWDPSYQMPEGAQLDVAGQRWNTVRGSFTAPTDGRGTVPYRACDAVQAKV